MPGVGDQSFSSILSQVLVVSQLEIAQAAYFLLEAPSSWDCAKTFEGPKEEGLNQHQHAGLLDSQAAAFKVCEYTLVQAGGTGSISATDLRSQVIWGGVPLGGSHKGQVFRRELHLSKWQNFVKYFPMSHSISHQPSILFYPPNISITSPPNGLSEDLFTPGVYLKQFCFSSQI